MTEYDLANKVIRLVNLDTDFLNDALIALERGRPHVVKDYVERHLNELRKLASAAREVI